MAPTSNSYLRQEYIARINRVMDFIDANLDAELTLEALARVAHFSPYHFHRIFRAMIGEPLFQYIQRIRLEKAATRLAEDPRRPVTRIALDCGFSGSAAFARAFREHFGMSASEWRRRGSGKTGTGTSGGKTRNAKSKTGKARGKQGKAARADSVHGGSKSHARRNHMKKLKANVEVRELPATHVAYVRNVGPYKGDSALFGGLIGRLCAWAGPRGHLGADNRIIIVYHDNPEITSEEKLRISVCLPVPQGTKVDGEVGSMTIAGGRYAVARFELATDEYQAAWDSVYGDWLPGSGYQPDDRPPFELYCSDPKDHPEGKCIVDICLPVAPL